MEPGIGTRRRIDHGCLSADVWVGHPELHKQIYTLANARYLSMAGQTVGPGCHTGEIPLTTPVTFDVKRHFLETLHDPTIGTTFHPPQLCYQHKSKPKHQIAIQYWDLAQPMDYKLAQGVASHHSTSPPVENGSTES